MSDVPTGTIAEVLDWVDNDPGRAQEALDAEIAGSNRRTLINQLESVCPAKEGSMTETTQDPDGVEDTTTDDTYTEENAGTDTGAESGVGMDAGTGTDSGSDDSIDFQDGLDEESGLAPGPEQPDEVQIGTSDAGTVIGAVHVRDLDVDVPEDASLQPDPATDLHPESDKTRAEAAAFDSDAEPEPIDGEQVEYLTSASNADALALSVNGTVYLFNKQMVGALKQAIDKAVVGLAF